MEEQNIFFTADLHFGDRRIIGYENRPYDSVQEMDEALIALWNETVPRDGTVFVLGDFSACGADRNRELLLRLQGHKILILGNHDRHFTPGQWRGMGFEEVSAWPVLYGEWFLLSHEPLYLNANMPYTNLFGHVHGSPLYRDISPQSYCVSIERTGYRPVAFEKIKNREPQTVQR